MNRRELETLLLTLESTPALLARAAAVLPETDARRRPAQGGFSFVENVWHLADLEREGYLVRIRRIRSEEHPALLNFDGERAARERVYQERDVERGLAQFARARTQSIEALKEISGSEWRRSGAQEGLGRVTLADIPRMMAEHDRSHETQIAALLALARGDKRAAHAHPTSAVA